MAAFRLMMFRESGAVARYLGVNESRDRQKQSDGEMMQKYDEEIQRANQHVEMLRGEMEQKALKSGP